MTPWYSRILLAASDGMPLPLQGPRVLPPDHYRYLDPPRVCRILLNTMFGLPPRHATRNSTHTADREHLLSRSRAPSAASDAPLSTLGTKASCARSTQASCARSNQASNVRSNQASCARSTQASCTRNTQASCTRSTQDSCKSPVPGASKPPVPRAPQLCPRHGGPPGQGLP